MARSEKNPRFRAVRLSRRSFLVATGGFSAAVAFGGGAGEALAQAAPPAPFKPNVWVTIGGDGIVTLVSPASEMGQGVMTAMPACIAEDMDADWKMIRVVQAPNDAKAYGNRLFGGLMNTGASRTTQGYYQQLRLVGAQTRAVLIAAAAAAWKVPAEELSTEPGQVVHAKSKRKISYGMLARTAKLPAELPKVEAKDLKPLAQCRLIGKDLPRVELPSKVTGQAQYGIDLQLPGMLYGAILRAPVQGEKPEKIDDAAAKAVKGVQHIVPLPYGVGVIAATYEAAAKAKDALKVEWTKTAKARAYDSAKIGEEYLAVARDATKAGVTVHKHGDAPAAIAGAAKTIVAEFLCDHVTHTCMEPMNATALVTGDRVEVWAPTQSQSLSTAFAARAAGTTPDKVKINTTLLGGGFGRRLDQDYTVDAVLLAKAAGGKPVKVIWSREDDIRFGKPRPLAAQHFAIGLDAEGKVLGWRHRLVGESIYARFAPPLFQQLQGKDPPFHDGATVKYALPAQLVEYVREQRGVDVHLWRAVGPGYTKFAIEVLIDELARERKQDPVAYRLALLEKEPRARAVIEAAAKMAEWGKPRADRLLGIAYSEEWNTHCAQVAEIALDRAAGTVRVHRVWCAVDPGIALQPANVAAQIESSIVYGIGAALFERLDYRGGEVQQSNFHDYRIMRMADMPEIETRVMPSLKDPPGGMGEVGLPPIAPAIANAIAAGTGAKLRHLPMTPERIKAAMRG